MTNNRNINRRKFLKWSATGVVTAAAGAWGLNACRMSGLKDLAGLETLTFRQDAKRTFSKCGACSHTLLNLLNREFGCPKITEEFAADPLAGGLMSTQNQCGMLWGAALAVGAESYRRNNNHHQAITMAMVGSQHVVKSFVSRAKSANCRDIIGIDISNKPEIAGFMVKSLPGGFMNMICMNLADRWFPEAVISAKEGLSGTPAELPQAPKSCSCEVAEKMGASEEEKVMVAGFAGGIGFSGNACGALGAAIWLNTLNWCKNNPGESGYLNPEADKIMKNFTDTTGSECLCSRLSGKKFETLDEHTEYVENGGCNNLIELLAHS